jgi:hypothetical protein
MLKLDAQNGGSAAYFMLIPRLGAKPKREKFADSPLLFLPEHMEEPEIIAFSRT